MEKTYLKIKDLEVVNFGKPNQIANAITWNSSELERGATSATIFCKLVYIDPSETEVKNFYPTIHAFMLEVPSDVLNNWLDDSVIDDFILASSSDFVKI